MNKIKIGADYEILYQSNPFVFKALRHGEEWRNLTGDNLMLDMFFMIEQLQEENQKLKDRLQISPQGDDKIDELEEAIEHLKFQLSKCV
jgi:hypothetical protein